MKRKINMIISLVSLSVTLCLLIVTMFAWYTSNKNVSANGIMGSSEGDNYSLKLQRGYYNANNGWNWIDTETISFSNISPGNVFFFRIVMDSSDENSFTAVFKDIDSEFQENKLIIENGYVCLKNSSKNIPLYKITDDKVKIGENNNNTLYSIDGNNIYLADYKIHNTFYFYSIGTTEPTDNSIVAYDKEQTKKLLSASDLSFNFTLNNTSNCYYFALEFNEDKSLETINGVLCSNAYLYQKLIIGYISVTKQ